MSSDGPFNRRVNEALYVVEDKQVRGAREISYRYADPSGITVLKTSRIALDSNVDAEGRNLHVQRLVELKHWARGLETAAELVTFHVLESPDPADAIIEYAQNNDVDHIVMGARASSAVRRILGSVSSQVVAEAACTVTVVRTPQHKGDETTGNANAPG